MRTFDIKALTESSLLTALTVIAALVSVYVPILGIAAALIWPLPVIVIVVRHGLRWGTISTIASTIIMSILIMPTIALRMALGFMLPALVLGYGFYAQWSAAKNLLLSLCVSVISMLSALALTFFIMDINPLAAQMDTLKESFDMSISLYETMGISAEELAERKAILDQSFKLLELIMPLVLVLSSLIVTILNFALGGMVLRRLGHKVNVLPPFNEWRFPQVFAYIMGFALVGLYWGFTRDIQMLTQVSLNFFFLCFIAGFIQGAALLRAITDKYHIPRVFYYMVVAFIFLSGLPGQVMSFTGIFDMVFDYRKRFNITAGKQL